MNSHNTFAPRIFLPLFALLCLLSPNLNAQYFRFGKNQVNWNNHNWHYIRSAHFDVYYYQPGGDYVATFTAKAAEDALEQIQKDIRHRISERITILVYQSHNDFAVNNAAPLGDNAEGIGGVTELFKNRVIIPFTGDYGDYRRLVHHELTHAVINDMFYGGSIQNIIANNIQLEIPLWFNEGICEYGALGWDTNSDMYVRDAIMNNELAPIPQLNGYFAYRGGQSVWDYIVKQYGREKIGDIFQQLRTTRSVEKAFKNTTGLALNELSEKWQESLKKQYLPEIVARENLNDIGKALITAKRGFLYNTAPAITPQGDKFAFITTRDGLFDIYLASTTDGRIIRKLADGQDNTLFESLKILSPGLSFDPTGTLLAVATKSKANDIIQVINVNTRQTQSYPVSGIDALIALAWSPDGKKIAFSASQDAQSDIYVLDLASGTSENITNDIFSDGDPTWLPNGQGIFFSSDRQSDLTLKEKTQDNFVMATHYYGQKDIYRWNLGESTLTRITANEIWDETAPKFAQDSNQMMFISDKNGIPNLYVKDLTSGTEKPLTDVITGITQVALSADGQKAVLNSLDKGTPSLFLLKDVFNRLPDKKALTPNIWAQRVLAAPNTQNPALSIASTPNLRNDPFLRDAADGEVFEYRLGAPGNIYRFIKPDSVSTAQTTLVSSDSTNYGAERIDYRNYVFGPAFDTANPNREPEDLNRFKPEDNQTQEGQYIGQKYKLKFSTDLVQGTAGYNTLYGAQGVTNFIFSDVLGNHQMYLSTNLVIDLREADYVFGYAYLPRRTDFYFQASHQSYILGQTSPTDGNGHYYRFRNFGFATLASYPLDKFRRLDFGFSSENVRQTNYDPVYIRDANNNFVQVQEKFTRSFFLPSVTYTKDVTTPGFLYPQSGYRAALSLSGSPGGIQDNRVQFATLLADARLYKTLARFYNFAIRLSGGHSLGKSPQLFYSSGMENWINYNWSNNQYPIISTEDFILARPVLPMRGYSLNNSFGNTFGLANAEFRFPIVAAVLPGPIPIIPLYNLQGVAFVDAGTIFGKRNQNNPSFNMWTTNADGEKVFDDLKLSAGLGLRTIVLGYPLRFDWAWQHNGKRFIRQPKAMISLGLDF